MNVQRMLPNALLSRTENGPGFGQSWQKTTATLCLALTVFACGETAFAEQQYANKAAKVLSQYCLDCHSGTDGESGVRLDKAIDWSQPETADLWEKVYDVVRRGEMPPPDEPQPTDDERKSLTGWLHQQLLKNDPVGGTVPRRLNRQEYENTIRELFDLPEFTVPDAFPADDSDHGFDNVGSGLVLSPPLMAQYLAVATAVADEVLPPQQTQLVAKPKTYEIGANGLASYRQGGVCEMDGRFRLASSRHMASSAAWPKLFEARESGVYRITVTASAFQTDKMFYERRTEPLKLSVYAKQKTDQMYAPFNEVRRVAEFDVQPSGQQSQVFHRNVKLFRGESFGLRWANGPAYSDPPVREFSTRFLADRLRRDRKFYAAMLQFRGGPRGISQPEYYDAITKIISSGKLDLTDPKLDVLPIQYGGGLGDAPHNWVKGYVHEELLRFGPALDIHDVYVEGPFELIDDVQTRQRQARKERFLGEHQPNATDTEVTREVLARFLPTAFRRPVTTTELNEYVTVAESVTSADQNDATKQNTPQKTQKNAPGTTQITPPRTTQKNTPQKNAAQPPQKSPLPSAERARGQKNTAATRPIPGLHLAIRRALISPHFLYRSLNPNNDNRHKLNEHDLASRLSYFLTSSPPDEQLIALANAGELSNNETLRRETLRLAQSPKAQQFIRSFTGQWLGTRVLKDIMPDPRLLPFFDADRDALIAETELFVAEILRENHPLTTFIDPDFSYRSSHHNKIYGLELKGHLPRRVTFERGGRHGGILGLASVMMATANGVDTHPVHRGVWLLENVFGTPTPPPPDNVPAIAPDTNGAQTIRAQLDAHTSDENCARCHRLIDPLGMLMENYDPVGRWRDHYPVYAQPKDGNAKLDKEFYSTIGKGTRKGPRVDAVSVLPNGRRLQDAVELKTYVLENMDQFTRCLTEKLMVYATGRPLSFGDRQVVEQIVTDTEQKSIGFRSLIVRVVQSESFQTK